MKRSGALPQDWELTQCLFGEHLLPQCPGRSVALVESEKTATPEQREAHIDIADLLIADCPTVGHPALSEGAEKGINFYALENRLFEELFKFLQACSNFRFSRGYYQKKTGHIALIFRFYCPVFGLFSQDLTQILLRHFAS